MGGRSIFVIKKGDKNANVIFETLTDYGQRFAMAQSFIPEITLGDKRILLIDGEAVPYAWRVFRPAMTIAAISLRARSAKRRHCPTRSRICEQVGPVLRDQGVVFAGIDVIGDYLTEVNVTSPTGIRELDKAFDLNIAGLLFDAIERKLS